LPESKRARRFLPWLAYGYRLRLTAAGYRISRKARRLFQMSINKDQVQGKIKQAEGKVQDAKGDLTDRPEDDVAGKTKKVEGKIQEAFGDAKKAIHDATK